MDRAHRALESVSEMIVRQQAEGASRLLFSPGSPIARPVLKGGAVLLSGAVVPDVGGGVVGRTVGGRLSRELLMQSTSGELNIKCLPLC